MEVLIATKNFVCRAIFVFLRASLRQIHQSVINYLFRYLHDCLPDCNGHKAYPSPKLIFLVCRALPLFMESFLLCNKVNHVINSIAQALQHNRVCFVMIPPVKPIKFQLHTAESPLNYPSNTIGNIEFPINLQNL